MFTWPSLMSFLMYIGVLTQRSLLTSYAKQSGNTYEVHFYSPLSLPPSSFRGHERPDQ